MISSDNYDWYMNKHRIKLEALKELQKFRNKKAGVNVLGLALGEKVKTSIGEGIVWTEEEI